MTNCLCFCCFYCKFYIYIFMCCGTLYVELWLCSIKKSNKFMEFWEFYAAYTIKEICALCNIGSLTYKLMLLMCLTKNKNKNVTHVVSLFTFLQPYWKVTPDGSARANGVVGILLFLLVSRVKHFRQIFNSLLLLPLML